MTLGTRVQIAPHLDRWMMGDRYGEVVKTTQRGRTIHVHLDRSGRTIRFAASNVMAIES